MYIVGLHTTVGQGGNKATKATTGHITSTSTCAVARSAAAALHTVYDCEDSKRDLSSRAPPLLQDRNCETCAFGDGEGEDHCYSDIALLMEKKVFGGLWGISTLPHQARNFMQLDCVVVYPSIASPLGRYLDSDTTVFNPGATAAAVNRLTHILTLSG